MHCDRCRRTVMSLTGAYFNTQRICADCSRREREHPQFEEARAAEEAAVHGGDFSFIGIGKPADL
jgi:hypothetical protein